MEREIKFRIWDGKQMICPEDGSSIFFLLHNSGYFSVQDHDNVSRVQSVNGMKDLAILNSMNDKLELMQFTGLKDKNHEDIYEGDIIKHNNNYIIKFSNNQFVLLAKQIGSSTNWRSLGWVNKLSKYIVRIGNIYENPELLHD